jgi:predicted lipoprotein with Yx(FWY)xxD motif
METRSRFVHARRPALLISLLATLALLLAACQSSATSTPTQAPAAPAPTDTMAPAPTDTAAAMVEEPTIMVATDAMYGPILVDGKGMTLYLFTNDTPGVSNCNAGCLAKWPPLLTNGSPIAGDGVDASKLGSAKLADGSMIVTYNGWPLYYWVNDTKPGDATGQGVGSVWYVLDPDGNPVGN